MHNWIADYNVSAVDYRWGFFGEWDGNSSMLTTLNNTGRARTNAAGATAGSACLASRCSAGASACLKADQRAIRARQRAARWSGPLLLDRMEGMSLSMAMPAAVASAMMSAAMAAEMTNSMAAKMTNSMVP